MLNAQWFDKRFVESATKLRQDCVQCGVSMWFPPSKHGKYLTCGAECAAARRDALTQYRLRNCLTCGKEFKPRTAQIRDGGGKYCSNACAAPTREAGRTPEVVQKRAAIRKAGFKSGRLQALKGEKNPRWKGGHEAYLARIKESGLPSKWNREYRKNNPEKVREFSKRRRGRLIGRLPSGTVSRIGALQKWKCAVCTTSILRKYHVDHVLPLAKGGEHKAENIQLLCPTCNVRKSAKHPVDFMQERGFLL